MTSARLLSYLRRTDKRKLTLGHSPDPDDAFMFYRLAKGLVPAGDETLKGSRQLWLYNPMHFSPEQAAEFPALRDSGLKVARAWAAKELFSRLWNYCYAGAAQRFFFGSGMAG